MDRAYDVYRVTNGKISEEWLATIMTQIGAFHLPWAA